ncbi:MarR family transcriptional regulator [Nonomuraea roseoviolacea subsp. roseoviolacea]|uniref:DNA-binding MarR family transcriptional regulator n=1 Tax=Nonomuraea roseoviolacea subsp. carminata TaxID=160689 RepID=A0ABT1K2I2_9ACTN|nr:MarR family transcriptional regulator [Nonomuraea roseoviolacea]MCP2348209.1 DNA-binding MarR family transcriptional regulator [Nonomuraea roseoviolacea subsp. carminata]
MSDATRQDGVDVIIEEWRAVRPDLDSSPMAVIGRLSRASRLLERAVKEEFARHGLESWEFDVLATLLRSGPPHVLSAGDLSAAAMVSSAALTNRVDRLVAKGLVDRAVDPDHRRRVLISLTEPGLRLVNEVVEHHLANESRLLDDLPAADRDQLAALLRRLLISLGDDGRRPAGA